MVLLQLTCNKFIPLCNITSPDPQYFNSFMKEGLASTIMCRLIHTNKTSRALITRRQVSIQKYHLEYCYNSVTVLDTRKPCSNRDSEVNMQSFIVQSCLTTYYIIFILVSDNTTHKLFMQIVITVIKVPHQYRCN